MARAPSPTAARAVPAAVLASRREIVLFRAAAGVVALHVVADAFLAPEPGVSRVEHLLPAAVPLALLAAAAWGYPRLRPGARASIALVLGVLALVWAGLEAANAAAVGPRGDDWTGFLLAPAGLALLLLGSAVLWRSRKRAGRRFLRRAVIALGALAAVFYLVVPAGLALFATHKPRSTVEAADLGRPYAEVTLRTADGLDLAGWYVPSRNGAAVIAFPGRRGTVPHARMLARHGYGVLLLDMRGQGESEGDPNAYGWGSTADVDAAVAFLHARPDVEDGRIGGLGLSVGGEQLLEAAAGNEALRAVVSDGAGERSYREELLRGPRGWLVLPLSVVLTTAIAVLSGDAPPPALDEAVAGIAPRPILLVQAGRGAGGEDLNPHYFEAAGEPKALWKIPEAGHTGGLDARPREYERRVVGFFDRALLRG